MPCLCRDDGRKPDPLSNGPSYARSFLNYLDENPSLNVIAFGLNCASPEDMMASFECIFAKTVTDEANNKVFHCVKTVLKCRFTYIAIIT